MPTRPNVMPRGTGASIARLQSDAGFPSNCKIHNVASCFTPDVRINTPRGRVAVGDLKIGDAVMTRDRGIQPVRWIGRSTRNATGPMRPVRIKAGALGQGLPERDLVVSQQQRLLVSSKRVAHMFDTREVLIPAHKLLDVDGVGLAQDGGQVTYVHLLLDQHEVIFAEGAATESMLTGPATRLAIGAKAMGEIAELCPDLLNAAAKPARLIPTGKQVQSLIARHFQAGPVALHY